MAYRIARLNGGFGRAQPFGEDCEKADDFLADRFILIAPCSMLCYIHVQAKLSLSTLVAGEVRSLFSRFIPLRIADTLSHETKLMEEWSTLENHVVCAHPFPEPVGFSGRQQSYIDVMGSNVGPVFVGYRGAVIPKS